MNPLPAAALIVLAALHPASGGTPPRRQVPESDSTILLTLPRTSFASDAPTSSRTPSTSDPTSAADPLETIRHWITQARRDADPRWLTRAQARLDALPASAQDAAETEYLRAEILQGLHQFRPALSHLDRILARHPRHAGAWQLKASLHQLLGDYAAARNSVLQLARWGPELHAATTAAGLAGMTTGPIEAAHALVSVIHRHPGAPSETLAWAWTTVAEIKSLHGDSAGAESGFQQALQLEPGSTYTRGALADLLLAQRRPAEAATLLEGSSADTLRIRLAEALTALPGRDAELQRLVAEIDEGFELSRVRGDALHQREQARFQLRVRRNPAEALRLATSNWETQREPADLLLWLESADAAADTSASERAKAWAQTHQPVVWQAFVSRRLSQSAPAAVSSPRPRP